MTSTTHDSPPCNDPSHLAMRRFVLMWKPSMSESSDSSPQTTRTRTTPPPTMENPQAGPTADEVAQFAAHKYAATQAQAGDLGHVATEYLADGAKMRHWNTVVMQRHQDRTLRDLRNYRRRVQHQALQVTPTGVVDSKEVAPLPGDEPLDDEAVYIDSPQTHYHQVNQGRGVLYALGGAAAVAALVGAGLVGWLLTQPPQQSPRPAPSSSYTVEIE